MRSKDLVSSLIAVCAVLFGTTGAAFAEGVAHDWQLNLQAPATPVMERVVDLHDILLYICFGVSIFVLALLVVVVLRFNRKSNPTPSKRSHHTLLEIGWTVAPILILVVIAIPSFRLIYFENKVEEADLTIKAIGHQWYWSYEYPDNGNFTFISNLLEGDALPAGGHRLLEVDNRVVVPAGKTVRLLITSEDVLHSFAMPSFGVKMDAVPGRLNETWFRVEKPGVYYGQCSEICGVRHGFMPIVIEARAEGDFENWVTEAQGRFARVDGTDEVRVALAGR
ncbi:cytochrome c oxidase subunit II [Tistrella mobilis]|uniref:Cytochrome c oxidase subunit 2 n=1 Tax=Tistrella mobilis (strain KA081020-065) TaxID=1110502 RepID=I3TPG4_TISMK|nr:cytochrome c oxidase subunit II [Tistrella mobilis]AFK54652.1 cytochrome C oxidase subunit II [Tistrella mobilis KA081020-065]MAM73223.1 cytochrome c oxidase subunit II [Tistrella sp.]